MNENRVCVHVRWTEKNGNKISLDWLIDSDGHSRGQQDTVVSPLWSQASSRCLLIMGIAKRGGHCLKAFYLNLRELNIKFFIKHSRSVAGKVIENKKPPEKVFITS